MLNIFKPEKINLLNHPEINEGKIQEIIAKDPSILGLGDLVLKDKERRQPTAGRLDLLLQDSESNRRYEVEMQLGKTDESHIIRTIEYWDIERKRYPQYEHSAVIIAEDITSRFLNVISLFNGQIPLIAIQMNAYKFNEDQVGLVFTTVLDEMSMGLVDEDEDVKEVTDRNYWINKGSEESVKMADSLLDMINEFSDRHYELKYNKFYISPAYNGQANNFVVFRPQRTACRIEVKLPSFTGEDRIKLESAGIDIFNHDEREGWLKIRLLKQDIENHREVLKELFNRAYSSWR